MLLAGVLLAGTAVILGAWGAHGLAAVVDNNPAKLDTWDTAVLYQFMHALALLFAGLWSQAQPSPWPLRAGVCMGAGVLLFSGSLYLLVLDGPGWLGPVTPLGGLFMIAGWMCAAVGVITAKGGHG